jgi:acyl-CoA thioester hydrolase
MEVVHAVRVRYGETDQMGVVYHPNYLLYFEAGRTELMRSAGAAYRDLEKRGVFLVVTEAFVRYRSAALYDELLSVRTRVEEIGKARIRFGYRVEGEDGRLCAEGHTELAALDERRAPIRLPAAISDLLRDR